MKTIYLVSEACIYRGGFQRPLAAFESLDIAETYLMNLIEGSDEIDSYIITSIKTNTPSETPELGGIVYTSEGSPEDSEEVG